ncbi:hypothetical protein SS1G_14246 [Sclerotinia sclerotiorum 1980 UF-70]|uniref:Uncharacterized protein n=1 Tax=Sclerotinia sclerotiorum (strain ATCC 18683 / 1980 / Ss-1) TaxID=665079 RepID=A7F9G5_SCLS1|nr:hypothetical protein SS1G_14246 [Sclerotinia sclerotiorum 1980 UF-70]EDO00376.1 hypothetical protein SS1G_14246 [Sclerotinia sclerotiorum 1980 UF-70]
MAIVCFLMVGLWVVGGEWSLVSGMRTTISLFKDHKTCGSEGFGVQN